MVGVPCALPDTIPVVKPTVASKGMVLLQVPPVDVLLKVMVLPTHTEVDPVVAAGAIFMVTVAYTSGPQPLLYVIGAVPCAIPVQLPVAGLIVAMVVAPLLHVPPVEVSPKTEDAPTHINAGTVMATGAALTVIG